MVFSIDKLSQRDAEFALLAAKGETFEGAQVIVQPDCSIRLEGCFDLYQLECIVRIADTLRILRGAPRRQ